MHGNMFNGTFRIAAAQSPGGIPSTLIFHSPSNPPALTSENPGSGLPRTDDRIAVWGLSEDRKTEYCGECNPTPHTANPAKTPQSSNCRLWYCGECIAWLSAPQLLSTAWVRLLSPWLLPDECKQGKQRWPRVVAVSRCPHDEIFQVASGRVCAGSPSRVHTARARTHHVHRVGVRDGEITAKYPWGLPGLLSLRFILPPARQSRGRPQSRVPVLITASVVRPFPARGGMV